MMKLVIISGRSGSGKSTALHVLEDAGFNCIDNLPAGLLPGLVAETASNLVTGGERLAVSIDARNISPQLADFPALLAQIPDTVATSIIYLDADDGTLIQRFSETRRKHPLSNSHTDLQEALTQEREILRSIADCADLTIDTRHMVFHELRDHVQQVIVQSSSASMSVLFMSFGFKRGLPMNADFVFDLRCLPNPHWNPQLRPKTGLDAEVAEFLAHQTAVEEMFADICQYLEKWLQQFQANNRAYTTVALGCTGGKHRSVYMANRLYHHFSQRFNNVQQRHREIEKAS